MRKICYRNRQPMNGMEMIPDRSIAVAGAGSIGCFVGGMWAVAGRKVALLARPRVIRAIEDGGLRLTSFEGLTCRIAADRLTLSEDPSIFKQAGMVVVTVKSADTAGIADIIAGHAPIDAVIVSLQNGIGNADMLRQRLPGRRVLAGMVPFNVIARGEAEFHRTTSGDILLERDQGNTAARLAVAGLPVRASDDITGVLMGQAAGQSQQRAQRAGRPAAAPATRAAIVAQAAGATR